MFHSTLIKGGLFHNFTHHVTRCLRIRSENVIQKRTTITLFNQNSHLNTFCDCFCLLCFWAESQILGGKKTSFYGWPTFCLWQLLPLQAHIPIMAFFHLQREQHSTRYICNKWRVLCGDKKTVRFIKKATVEQCVQVYSYETKTPMACTNHTIWNLKLN